MKKQARDVKAGDRIHTEYGPAIVSKVIHDGPRAPEMQIAFEGAIGHKARLDYLPTEILDLTE